jgi:NADH dehydrogenase FAD-containing subunit
VLTWPSQPDILNGKPKTIQTSSGHTLTADIILPCTGQKPITLLMAQLSPSAISTINGRIKVHKTLQLDNADELGHVDEDLSHIFACGDCADTRTGAIQAGHTAYHQGEMAANNIIKLVQGLTESNGEEGNSGEQVVLGEYKATPPGIKVTLGLVSSLGYLGCLMSIRLTHRPRASCQIVKGPSFPTMLLKI